MDGMKMMIWDMEARTRMEMMTKRKRMKMRMKKRRMRRKMTMMMMTTRMMDRVGSQPICRCDKI